MFLAECRGESSLVWHLVDAPVEKSNGMIFLIVVVIVEFKITKYCLSLIAFDMAGQENLAD